MIEIRLADNDDLPFLIQLEEQSFSSEDRFSRAALRGSITSKSQYVYIISKNKAPVGAAILHLHKNCWRLYSIAILPAYRKLHLGAYLLSEIIKRASEKYLQKISLEVNAENRQAIRFYERFGFKYVKDLPGYYGENTIGLKMELTFYPLSQKLKNIIVVDDDYPFLNELENLEIINADRFINDPRFKSGDYRVFNLCDSYHYQKKGYYVSLFAAARNFRVIPNIATIEDLHDKAIVNSISNELRDLFRTSLKQLEDDTFKLEVIFGKARDLKFSMLATRLYNLFPSPFLLFTFKKEKRWHLHSIETIPPSNIESLPFLMKSALSYFAQKKFMNPRFRNYKYDLAILVDDNDPAPPSNKMALRLFLKAARKLGFYTEIITKDDYHRLRQFDALFIRATTNPNDYTYQFSRLAYAEGLVVIDDPWSILRCANKVYLHESMNTNNIKTPRTVFVTQETALHKVTEELGFPLVLKRPDSSASLGVFKVSNLFELEEKLSLLFESSDIILAQEYIQSDFDWRVGVLSNQAIYVCKYFMAKNHWQIYHWKSGTKSFDVGEVETLLVEEAPARVVTLALKAAAVMGDGFYGVDIKESRDQVYVIEVNDNPSIDRGWEDGKLGNDLYMLILRDIYERIEKARMNKSRLSLPNID